jgi:hypothetical protein
MISSSSLKADEAQDAAAAQARDQPQDAELEDRAGGQKVTISRPRLASEALPNRATV